VIREVLTKKGAPAITSDQWHVVHAHFTAGLRGAPFVRGISSEHAERSECVAAARQLRGSLHEQNAAVAAAERDQVFVRRPHFKSLKRARRRLPKPK
jgi:hypothetical protein